MKQPDFNAMNRTQLQQCCLSEEADANIKLLYWLDFYLNDCENSLYKEISRQHDERRKNELKSEMNWTKNFVEVVKRREADVQFMTTNYHFRFRLEAQRLLPVELYGQIDRQARETA